MQEKKIENWNITRGGKIPMNKIDMSGFDTLIDNLEQHVNEQGYTLGDQAELLQNLLYSLNMCHLHDIVTDSQAQAMTEKFAKLFYRALRKIER